MPWSSPCVVTQYAWLESSSAFDGMQPTVTHIPPTRSRSTTATFAPLTAAWSAATYPPGPPPRIAMSYEATTKEPRVFRRVSLQWMLGVSVPRAIPEVQGQERETEPLVLRDVAQLVAPYRRRRFDAGNDDVPERDRAEAAPGQDEIRETAIADVEEAAVATSRESERKQSHHVTDGIGVVREEDSAEAQGMVATTSSTAATTRSRVVTAESKYSVMSRTRRSTATDAPPSICRHPARTCSPQP